MSTGKPGKKPRGLERLKDLGYSQDDIGKMKNKHFAGSNLGQGETGKDAPPKWPQRKDDAQRVDVDAVQKKRYGEHTSLEKEVSLGGAAQADQTQEPTSSAPAESNTETTEKENADVAEKETADTAEKDAILVIDNNEPCTASPNQEITHVEQTPVEENGPSSALVAARSATPTHRKQLTTMNEKDLADNSPRARIRTYAASDHQFGLTSSPNKDQNHRKPRICLDHFGVSGVPSEEQLQELFKVFDTNSDGKISLVEFRGVFQDSFENYGAPMEDRDVDRLFAKFDTGAGRRGQARDGFLSYDEFCILVLNRLRQ